MGWLSAHLQVALEMRKELRFSLLLLLNTSTLLAGCLTHLRRRGISWIFLVLKCFFSLPIDSVSKIEWIFAMGSIFERENPVILVFLIPVEFRKKPWTSFKICWGINSKQPSLNFFEYFMVSSPLTDFQHLLSFRTVPSASLPLSNFQLFAYVLSDLRSIESVLLSES